MEDLFYNPELEELTAQPEEEKGLPEEEKEDEPDEIDEDLSYLDEDVEDIDEEDEDDFEFFFGNDYKKYVNRKIYKDIPVPKGGKVIDTGRESYKRLLAKGYNPKVLAAIIGNGVVESNLNPGAVGDSGTAFGINQNRFEKADYFNKEFSKADSSLGGLDKHIAAQYQSVKNNYPGIFKKVSNARNFNEAAMVYGREYEKPKHLKGDRGVYADLVTKQSGGYIDEEVMQTAGLANPFNKYDTGGKSLFSENTRNQTSYMGNTNHIGYSPPRTNLQATVPADFGKYWNQSSVQYSRDNTKNTTLDIAKNLDPTGVSQIVDAVDKTGAMVFDTVNDIYNFSKKVDNTGAMLADSGTTIAKSIYEGMKNDIFFNKELKNTYKESEQQYYG